MHQRRRVQRLGALTASLLMLCDGPQLFVNQRKQLLSCRRIAASRLLQELRDVVFVRIAQIAPNRIHRRGRRSGDRPFPS